MDGECGGSGAFGMERERDDAGCVRAVTWYRGTAAVSVAWQASRAGPGTFSRREWRERSDRSDWLGLGSRHPAEVRRAERSATQLQAW